MTGARNNRELMAPEVAQTFTAFAGVGLGLSVLALITAMLPATRDQFFHAYLIGFMFWLGISLGSMAFLLIQHLTGGKWGMVIRRQLEAAMKVLPLMLVLFLPIAAAGIPHLYGTWLHPDQNDKHLVMMRQTYLTPGGYAGRAVIYFAIWLTLSFILNRWSVEQDNPPVQNLSPRFRKIAAPGLILYAFTITFASIDWVLSCSIPSGSRPFSIHHHRRRMPFGNVPDGCG
jgi:hypothetical protein